MARLTVPPNFVGTTGIDILVGEEFTASPIVSSPTIGIDILTGGFIRTRSGNDIIKGISKGTTVTSFSGDGGSGTGIANRGSLNSGDGEDTIIGTATGSIGGNGVVVGDGGSGTGIANSASLNAGEKKDTIIGTGTGGIGGSDGVNGGNGGNGVGIANSGSLNTEDEDTITGIGTGGDGNGATVKPATAVLEQASATVAF